MKVVQIESENDLKTFAVDLLPKLSNKQIISLEGPMGAGKTTFVHYLISALGGSGSSSPTFALQQRYKTNIGEVHHIDLYRVKSEQDLESTGFWDLFSDSAGLILVEWGDRLEHWPLGWKLMRLQFQIVSTHKRKIALTLNK